jgi:hypothetical protein
LRILKTCKFPDRDGTSHKHGLGLSETLNCVYSDEIATDSETKWHSIRANRHSEESERSDAGILYIA